VLPLAGLELNCLQIGAYTGDATEWLMRNVLTNPNSHLTDVDTWEGSDELIHKSLDWGSVEDIYDQRATEYKNLTKVKCTSDEFFKMNVETFDFIYVDGDHTALGVLKDGMSAVLALRPNGILAFDDYTWRSGKGPIYDPKQSIDAIRNAYALEFHTIEVGAQVWLKKKEA
jgi:predicted O-methyltransferase YrrM